MFENAILKVIPPELLQLASIAGEWFANSGYKEAIEATGTTGLNHLIINIEGRPHIVTFAISRPDAEELEQINATLLGVLANKQKSPESEE
jgi:hypothetical protein